MLVCCSACRLTLFVLGGGRANLLHHLLAKELQNAQIQSRENLALYGTISNPNKPLDKQKLMFPELEGLNNLGKITLSEEAVNNLSQLSNLGLDKICFKDIRNFEDINEKWRFVKEEITKVIDEIAPVRKITLKNPNQFPWYDDDLIRLKH